VGDDWEYKASDKMFGKEKKLNWRVKNVDSAGVLEELFIDDKANSQYLFVSNPDLIGVPIDSGFFFGSQWDGNNLKTLSVRGTGDCVVRYQCEVKLEKAINEKVVVPAGAFDAIRYEGSISAVSTGVRYTVGKVSVWYSERERRLIKQTTNIRSAIGLRVDEVVKLQSIKSRN
jgi:hypothetical protein